MKRKKRVRQTDKDRLDELLNRSSVGLACVLVWSRVGNHEVIKTRRRLDCVLFK